MKIILIILISFQLFANDLQEKINNSGVLYILDKDYEISTNIYLNKSNFILDGGGHKIFFKGKDSGIKIVGKTLYSTNIIHDTFTSKGLSTINPELYVENISEFKKGQIIRLSQGFHNEFNKILDIKENKKMLILSSQHSQKFKKGAKLEIVSLVENLTIKNLTISGLYNNAIDADKTSNLKIYDNYFVENRRIRYEKNSNGGVVLINESFMPVVRNNIFQDNGLKGLGDDSIGISHSYSPTIEGNQISSSGAIVLRGVTLSNVNNNLIDSTGRTGGDGISLIGVNKSKIQHNSISRVNCYGLWAHDESNNNIISNNIIISGITSGIFLNNGANENIISNNIIMNNNGNGIFIGNKSDKNIISNNFVKNNNSRGILIHGKDNILESSNKSEDNKLENVRIDIIQE